MFGLYYVYYKGWVVRYSGTTGNKHFFVSNNFLVSLKKKLFQNKFIMLLLLVNMIIGFNKINKNKYYVH